MVKFGQRIFLKEITLKIAKNVEKRAITPKWPDRLKWKFDHRSKQKFCARYHKNICAKFHIIPLSSFRGVDFWKIVNEWRRRMPSDCNSSHGLRPDELKKKSLFTFQGQEHLLLLVSGVVWQLWSLQDLCRPYTCNKDHFSKWNNLAKPNGFGDICEKLLSDPYVLFLVTSAMFFDR